MSPLGQSLQHINLLNNENTNQRLLKEPDKQDSKATTDKSIPKPHSDEQSDNEERFSVSYKEEMYDDSKCSVVIGRFTCSINVDVNTKPTPCCGNEQCRQCFQPNEDDSMSSSKPLPFPYIH